MQLTSNPSTKPPQGGNLNTTTNMKKYAVTFGEDNDPEKVTMKLEAESVEQVINLLKETWETEFISSIVTI